MKRKIITTVILIAAGLLLLTASIQALGEKPITPFQEQEENIQMKVNFYTIDRQKIDKGEFVGTAELKEGKLEVNVTDPKLEKLLKEPYQTMAGEVKDGVARDWLVTYQPGTKEHLQAIALECYRFGYIGEVVEE
jgi:hypothetical protein